MAGKHRKWLAFMSVSASGPEFSPILEHEGRLSRPRMAADLKYTTADVDFLEAHFKVPNYDSGFEENHYRLRNPTREQFFNALNSVEPWLGKFRGNPDWDGGGFMICYAGHGRNRDGALVLEDGVVAPGELVDTLAGVAREVSSPGRLRVSVVLDSCHSGAFATELIDSCFCEYEDLLVPWMIFASCMDDEVAWEESGLGHGIFTYCFSAREHSLGSFAAHAVQPDNTFGPSLSIASGEQGCSLLTAGAQNPVTYFNGTGMLEICRKDVNLFEDGEYIGLEATREKLRQKRNKFVAAVKQARPDLSINGTYDNEEEERTSVRKAIQSVEEMKAFKKEIQ